MQNKESVLIGYSGHGKVVGEAAFLSNQNLRYYVEKKIIKDNPYDLEFLGNEKSSNFKGFNKDYNAVTIIRSDGKVSQIKKNKKSFIASIISGEIVKKLLINDKSLN